LPDEALSLLPRATAPWWLALSVGVYNASLMGTPERADPYLHLALTTSPDTVPSGAYGQALQVLAAGAALVGRASIGWALVEQFECASSGLQAGDDAVFRAWFDLSKCILASNSVLDGQWQLGAALRWGEASLAAMRALGAVSGEAACLFHLGNAYWLAGSFERALSLLRLAMTLGKQIGNRLVEEHAAFLLAVAGIKGGSQAEALKTLTSLAASRNQQISHAATAVLADSFCRAGDFEAALVRARSAAEGSSLMYRRMARATLARAYLGLGQFAASIEATEEAFTEGESSAFPHLTVDLLGARAQALLACGAAAEAERTVREACAFRDAVTRGIDDEASRSAFRTRGRANRSLDELAARLAVSSSD
jgi:tetratricopeptide (TPR) repeat protein